MLGFQSFTVSGVVSKYFLDKNGVQTNRMANLPGKGHFDLAVEITGQNSGDLYKQMFDLGYARVLEREDEIHVESPKPMTRAQSRFLTYRSAEIKKPVVLNDRKFIESKDPRAAELVKTLLEA